MESNITTKPTIYVSFECLFKGTLAARDKVIEIMRRSYDDGDKVNEKVFLDSMDWYKLYTSKASLSDNTLTAIRRFDNMIIVSRDVCQRETLARYKMLLDFGYERDFYSIGLKKPGHEIIDATKPEQHYTDIIQEGFAVTGNILVVSENDEAYNWVVRNGARAFIFDPKGKSSTVSLEDDNNVIYTVKKLTKLPKMLGIDKK